MKNSRLFLSLIKQYIKKPGFLLLLLLLPLLTLYLSGETNNEIVEIKAVFYMEDSFFENKLESYNGIFRFELLDNPEEVYSAVASNKAECGYIFEENFYQRLLDNDFKDIIITVSSPRTTMLSTVNEVLFSLIFEELALDSLQYYLEEDSVIASQIADCMDSSDIRDLYEKYLFNDSTFRFEYNDHPEEYVFTTSSVLLSPVRGLLAVFLLLASMIGAINYYKLSEEHYLFRTPLTRLFSVLLPVIFTIPFILLCLILGNQMQNIPKELGSLLLYSVACVIFSFLLASIIRKRVIFTSILPIFILGCFVFTPVFLDITLLIPAMKPLSYLFLPYYYLSIF